MFQIIILETYWSSGKAHALIVHAGAGHHPKEVYWTLGAEIPPQFSDST